MQDCKKGNTIILSGNVALFDVWIIRSHVEHINLTIKRFNDFRFVRDAQITSTRAFAKGKRRLNTGTYIY